MAKHDDMVPFSSYEHMYCTIDNIKHGDAPWKSFTTSYAGELDPNAPSWQLQDFEVWFRDLDLVVRNMLDNPDLNGHFDYAPYIDLDKAGNRIYVGKFLMEACGEWINVYLVLENSYLIFIISIRLKYLRQMQLVFKGPVQSGF